MDSFLRATKGRATDALSDATAAMEVRLQAQEAQMMRLASDLQSERLKNAELERQLAISRQASRAPSEYASPARGGAQEDWDEE